MERVKAFFSWVCWVVFPVTALPVLALAQGSATGSSPSPSGAAPAGSTGVPSGSPGGTGWLWIVAALVVLAILWWAMSTRRRHGTVTR